MAFVLNTINEIDFLDIEQEELSYRTNASDVVRVLSDGPKNFHAKVSADRGTRTEIKFRDGATFSISNSQPKTIKIGDCYIMSLEMRPGRGIHITNLIYNTTTKTYPTLVPPAPAGKIVAAAPTGRKSSIKGKTSYSWYIYQGKDETFLRRGKVYLLTKGSKFGVRSASSDQGKYRIIFDSLGENTVFSSDQGTRDRIVKNSTPTVA